MVLQWRKGRYVVASRYRSNEWVRLLPAFFFSSGECVVDVWPLNFLKGDFYCVGLRVGSIELHNLPDFNSLKKKTKRKQLEYIRVIVFETNKRFFVSLVDVFNSNFICSIEPIFTTTTTSISHHCNGPKVTNRWTDPQKQLRVRSRSFAPTYYPI